MPIFKREKQYVPTADGSRDMEIERITHIKPNGEFWIEIPDHLKDIAQVALNGDEFVKGFVTGDKLSVARNRWESAIHKIREYIVSQVKEKVIHLKVGINAYIFEDKDPNFTDDRPDLKFQSDDFSFVEISPTVGVSFNVCYRVGDKLIDEDGKYICGVDGGGGRMHDDGKNVIIPHTDEREAFLARMVKSLEEVALKLESFRKTLSDKPLEIDSMIQAGNLLEYKRIDP